MSQPHIVVVGAGILGASIAFHLSRRGAAVTLLDAGDPGQGASLASFAWMNAHGKSPRHYHDLNRRSLDMWDRFVRILGQETGQDLGVTWGGELRWAATEAGGIALTDRARQLQSWGYPIRLVDPAQVRQMEPDLVAGSVTAATHTEIEGHVDAQKVIRACIAGVEAHGNTTRWHTPLTAIQRDPTSRTRTISGVVVGDDLIPCDCVVLAGGPDTPELAEFADVHAPVYHTFGCTIVTEPMPPLFQTVALVHTPRDAEPPINVRQLPDGSVVVHGGTHGGSHDRSLGQTLDEVEEVMAAATRYLPSLATAPIREVRRARRPIPQDGLPIIGFAPGAPNLYVAAMHSGVTLSALVGEFATTEILDGADIEILTPYRPHRFATV